METQERLTAALTGKEGSEIALAVAAEWTRNYRQRHPDEAISHFFGNDILHTILGQSECAGMRIYYANSKPLNGWQSFIMSIANFLRKNVAGAVGDPHVIITGVSCDGCDMLPGGQVIAEVKSEAAPAGASGNTIGEQSVVCPGGAGCPKNVLTGGA
jgi:hypothetical protein